MLTRILAIFSISLAVVKSAESAPTAEVNAKQFLYARPGYVPVYIRAGNTPLEEINPDLAEAFRIHAQKHGRLTYGRAVGDKLDDTDIKKGDDKKDSSIDLESVDVDASIENNSVIYTYKQSELEHVQKIPRS